MKQILIDRFEVPEHSLEEFTQRMNYNRGFLSKLPGFLSDAAYSRTDDRGNIVIVTIAEWGSHEAIRNAKEAVQTEYARIGFRLDEMMSRLNITMDRGIYAEFQQVERQD